jgi:hypothetical protein
MELRPFQIFYSQDSISNKFGDYTRHAKMCIGETLDHLLVGRCNVEDILTMRVMETNGKWFTSDNRRLWVFRTAEEIGFLKTVKVKVISLKPDKKFTTVNHGQSVRVRKDGPGGKIWRNWKPQRPISNTVNSYQPSFYLNRSDASSGNTFTTIRDNVSNLYNENRHGAHLSFHSNICSSKNCDGVIVVGDLHTKMQLGTDHLPPRKIIYQENNSSDIKSTDYGKADDAQSSKPSVISDRHAGFDQSWENRNNKGDVQSYNPSVMSDRQTSLDQSCENRNNMDDVRSHIPSVIYDRQAGFDQSWEIRSNLGDVQSYKSLRLPFKLRACYIMFYKKFRFFI